GALNLPVETIGQRFGAVADTLPRFELPDFSWATVRLLVAPTLTLALLGAVESLLCARVADQVSGLARHNPNQELMAQGIANLVVPYFGGMPVTGTIARTVTNIRAGATSPVSGMVHALTLAALVLVAAPLSQHIPLAVLGGVLLFVAWNMGEWREFAKLRHFSVPYRVLLLSTFSVTVVFDLTVAVQLGLVLACVFFILRQQDIFRVYMASTDASQTIDVKLYGSLFFGTVGKLDMLLVLAERCQPGQEVVLHAQRLITLDTTGLDALRQLADGLQRRGAHLSMLGVQPQPASLLGRSGFALRLHRLEIEKA
ncbi:MAG: SulP family inorganic anion transporter, partial [Burkholderiaceae bacterium]